MKLGLVSYNVARDWDLPTVLKNCAAAGIAGFEARTTHAHGIEPTVHACRFACRPCPNSLDRTTRRSKDDNETREGARR